MTAIFSGKLMMSAFELETCLTSIHETDCAAIRFELELIVQELHDIEEAATRLSRRISAMLHSSDTAVTLDSEANIDTSDAAATSDDNALGGHTAPKSADGPLAIADLPGQSDTFDLVGPQASCLIVKVAQTAVEEGESEATSHSSVCRCELPAPIEIVIEPSAEDVDFVPSDTELPASAEPIRLIALPVVHSNQALVIIPSPQKPMHRSWVAPFGTAVSVMLVGLLVLCTNSDVPSIFAALARHWI